MTGQFYQPDGSNAPGSVMGTFDIDAGGSADKRYHITGAFGAEKR